MKRNFWIYLSSLAALLFAGCTLYLDDDEIASVDRSDNAGFVETQTVETEDGTVKYKYAKNTLPIDDEVESYIPLPVENHAIFYFGESPSQSVSQGSRVTFACRDKSVYSFDGRVNATQDSGGIIAVDCVLDSIKILDGLIPEEADSLRTYSVVYFMEDTPEDLLPEEGEVLVCSYREKFPDAFCHRVIERTLVNGFYRCICSAVGYEEAFEYLEADMNVESNFNPNDSVIDASEYMDGFEPDFSEDGSGSRRSYDYSQTRGWFEGWELNPVVGPQYFYGQPETTITGTVLKILSGSITFGGGVYAKPVMHLMWKVGDNEHTKFSAEITGGVKYKFIAKLSAGGDFDLPLSIPILGEKIDLYVVGAEAGLYATPYFHYDRSIDAGFEFDYGISLEFGYEGFKDQGGSAFCTLADSKKKGTESLKINYSNDAVIETVQAGLKFELGVGIKPGIALAAGVKVFAEFTQELDISDKLKVDAVKNKNMPITIKGVPYAKADADLIFISLSGEVDGDPVFGEGKLWLQMYPDLKEIKFYKSCADPKEFSMGYTINNQGLIGWLTGTGASMRVVEKSSKKVVETYKLKAKKDDPYVYYLNGQKGWNIKDNTDYIVQCYMTSTFGYEIDLDELPINIHTSEIYVKNLYLMETNTDEGPFVRQVWGVGEKKFKYRYRVRMELHIENLRNVRKWAVHCHNATLSICADKEDEPNDREDFTVDWYIYTNTKKEQRIYFEPSIYLQDDAGNPINNRLDLSKNGQSLIIEYNSSLEHLDPGWGNPDFEP